LPELKARLEIPPASTGIGAARRFAREQLEGWGLDGLVETTVLVISELVTNAILHGGRGAVLTLTADSARMRAEVRDGSASEPVMRSYSETATTGRGMVIVDALAAAWGSFPVDGGKVVWFELETGQAAGKAPASSEASATRVEAQRGSSDLEQPFSGTLGGDSDQFPSARVRVVVTGLVRGT
jgi:anti-sigma regulatory factor (Ser/Thr protein kinase)